MACQKTFSSGKYKRADLNGMAAMQQIDLPYAKSVLAPDLEKSGHAVKIIKIDEIKLKAGAVVGAYDANSEPNAVTNKKIRQENEQRYYYAKESKLVRPGDRCLDCLGSRKDDDPRFRSAARVAGYFCYWRSPAWRRFR